ncbi:hypothetical protein NAL32_13150 [Chryseobacterium sp. Ch-15]|uniref:Uncharacterized protein n=1 Tax=Chryseobacterium muglaense TaxID=2893752 RepID=A0A9Q3UZ67_9FLAO|nr:hypothetical protein [Chryseobacterium muglaense]MBD3906868.1 hypothetical protein [Chryseobacterium muglaense]MCC9036716.1 hypothetical protein [Chryseobacterium muglaense]MCM2555331.1 hypothetical protein [Chryseobacterium muglaense]
MYNIISYLLFLAISSYIIVDVGRRCFNSGKIYLEYLIKDKDFCLTVNRILLASYYLVNLGYIAINLSFWNEISNIEELLTNVSTRIGIIVLILCALHFINIATLFILRKKLTIK